MSIFGPTEHQPTDSVEAPRAVRLEVSKIAAPRSIQLANAVGKVNTADKASNSMASLVQQQPERVGGVVAGNAIAQPVSYGEPVDDSSLIDKRLGYAKYNPQAYSAAEASQIMTGQPANNTVRSVLETQPATIARSEYEVPTEVTAAGPQVPEEVSYASKLHEDILPQGINVEDARKGVSDAYDLAA